MPRKLRRSARIEMNKVKAFTRRETDKIVRTAAPFKELRLLAYRIAIFIKQHRPGGIKIETDPFTVRSPAVMNRVFSIVEGAWDPSLRQPQCEFRNQMTELGLIRCMVLLHLFDESVDDLLRDMDGKYYLSFLPCRMSWDRLHQLHTHEAVLGYNIRIGLKNGLKRGFFYRDGWTETDIQRLQRILPEFTNHWEFVFYLGFDKWSAYPTQKKTLARAINGELPRPYGSITLDPALHVAADMQY